MLQPEQLVGHISSCEVVVALTAMAPLAMTAALVELETLVAVLPPEAAVAADIVLGVVVGTTLLACTAPSGFTAVDVEVEVTVTMIPVPVVVTVPDSVMVTVGTVGTGRVLSVVDSFPKTVVIVVVKVKTLVA